MLLGAAFFFKQLKLPLKLRKQWKSCIYHQNLKPRRGLVDGPLITDLFKHFHNTMIEAGEKKWRCVCQKDEFNNNEKSLNECDM